jgi:hypothetical protein
MAQGTVYPETLVGFSCKGTGSYFFYTRDPARRSLASYRNMDNFLRELHWLPRVMSARAMSICGPRRHMLWPRTSTGAAHFLDYFAAALDIFVSIRDQAWSVAPLVLGAWCCLVCSRGAVAGDLG